MSTDVQAPPPGWIVPGEATTLAAEMLVANDAGRLGLIVDEGPQATKDHPMVRSVRRSPRRRSSSWVRTASAG